MKILKAVLRVGMAVFYVVAGVNHFRDPEFYQSIMPPYLPMHQQLVYLSGIAEITLGIMAATPRSARLAAWGIILMLLAFLPVHVHMLINNHLYTEIPTSFLWLRFPAQGLLILWAYCYTLAAKEARDRPEELSLGA
jgi:uncharacterized membrane protein